MAKDNKGFLKRNRLFISIVVLILVLIVSLVTVHYFTSQTHGDELPTDVGINDESKDQEPVIDVPQLTNFKASDTKDIVKLSWTLNQKGLEIDSVDLYMNENFVANVAGYSSWTLNKSAYALTGGEVEFSLKVKFSDTTIANLAATTNLELHTDIDSKVSISRDQSDYIVSITYKSTNGKVKSPSIYIAGISGDLFSVENNNVASESSDKEVTSYRVRVDDSVADGTILAGRFRFENGDISVFEIIVEKDNL